MDRPVRAWPALLIAALVAGCARNYDHKIAVVECDGKRIEVVERYRRASVSGHTLASRTVLVVGSGPGSRDWQEIDITPVDTVDLSAMERTLPAAEQWRQLAPHEKASRRVFVSPEVFSPVEYATIASCLGRHAGEINRAFATPRAPVEYFDGYGFRDRWAGLRSIAYRKGVWDGNPCMEKNTSGFRFACAGTPFFLSVDSYGYVRFCEPSDPTGVCGRAVGLVSADGSHAVVRAPDLKSRCAQGAFAEWSAGDWRRFYRECRLTSGQALQDLLEIRESETLDTRQASGSS